MTRCLKTVGALVAAALLFGWSAPPANAALTGIQQDCFEAIAKGAAGYVKTRLKVIQKCNDANLKAANSCLPASITESLTKAETKFRDTVNKVCPAGSPAADLLRMQNLGFPAQCAGDVGAFSSADMMDCQFDNHERLVDDLLTNQYGDVAGPLTDKAVLSCQKTIAKEGAKYSALLLKEVQKCRNGLNSGKLLGFPPTSCEAQPKTADKLAKGEQKFRDAVAKKCSDPGTLAALDVCDTPATTVLDAQNCLVEEHKGRTRGMISFEYATPKQCGDNQLNRLDEECDGVEDDACPGECGDPNDIGNPLDPNDDGSFFACLCKNIPRERAIEHANADLDNGWSGQSHDAGIVEGGGFVLDLYDCDNLTDFDCNTGPHCTGGAQQGCSTDADCGIDGPCRKRRTAVGPHCNLNIQQACLADGSAVDPACTGGSDDFCVQTSHGPPLPLSAGGISVCLQNIFREDVIGTTNLQTGSSAFRLRQSSITHLSQNSVQQPCPVCGGFCDLPSNPGGGPGGRTICATDDDCPSSVKCVTEPICSFGPNKDKTCRRTAPNGNLTDQFGTTSVDCPPDNNISGQTGLDILFNPATTATLVLEPSIQCEGVGFTGKVCKTAASPLDVGKVCTVDADCPGGGAGSCAHQCFCPGTGLGMRPNACDAACVSSGADDKQACTSDVDCPTGFCHLGDCRVNPTDTDSNQEGICTVGPSEGACSKTIIKGCSSAAECAPPTCAFCKSGRVCSGGANTGLACAANSDCPGSVCLIGECIGGANEGMDCTTNGDCPGGTCGETCEFANRQCFVNQGIVRTGTPGVPDRETAAIFCIPVTQAPSVNATSGLPGPGSLLTPATSVLVGF